MKIECPSCHLTGKIHETDIPPEGRHFDCPRCKTGFHIAKPPPPSNAGHLMNICPVCQYSTFTEELFAVCPKCGVTGSDYKEMLRKKSEREQLRHDQEVLHRSHRNPDLVMAPLGEAEAAKPKVPQPIMVTGWLCVGAGAALLFYGISGLSNYYGKDWQSILSTPYLEPVSKTRIFFSLGFLPWLRTLMALCLIVTASRFLTVRRRWALRGMAWCAWGGVALGVITEIAGFVKYVNMASSSPSFAYYAVGIIGSIVKIALWSAPFLALLWYLRRDSIIREFPED